MSPLTMFEAFEARMTVLLSRKHPVPITLWFIWVILVAGVVSGFSLFYPAFLASSAYSWVITLFGSFQIVGIVNLVTCLFVAHSLFTGYAATGTLGLGLFMWVQFLFGLSIFALTFTGATAAISGAFQWWTSVAVSAYILHKGI